MRVKWAPFVLASAVAAMSLPLLVADGGARTMGFHIFAGIILGAAAYEDAQIRRLANAAALSLVFLAIGRHAADGMASLVLASVLCASVFGIMIGLHFSSGNGRVMGAGDVKLFAAIGAYVGDPLQMCMAVMAACAVTGIWMALRGVRKAPLGPGALVGFVVAVGLA